MSDKSENELPAMPSDGIVSVDLSAELKSSYLSYAMSVIVSRAIPDVRDGLKYVQRRILYSMHSNGFYPDKPYKKSSRIVGDVMGKYHPHGDSSIYDALVRMAQPFSLLIPVIDGQGNFGSIDGDSPAAMRYTEARLAPISKYILEDINENSVDFRANYDGLEKEPAILPSRIPYILLNGASGVAVGMATNIPTHNLSELIDASMAYIDNPDITVDELMKIIPGPDFPTGGVIGNIHGIRSAFETGKGSITISGKTHFEEFSGKQVIVIDELPYQVNKSRLMENIADLVRDKRIETISDLRDESDKSGIRVVVELKRNAIADVVLNQLMKFTQLKISFGINMMILRDLRPTLMSLKDIFASFVQHRREVITRRTQFRLEKFKERANGLVALYVAVLNIDLVVSLIRAAKDAKEASRSLLDRSWEVDEELVKIIEIISGIKINKDAYYLSDFQVHAILEMRLNRLTNVEKGKLQHDLTELIAKIQGCIDLLSSNELLINVILSELQTIKDEFNIPRRTDISHDDYGDIDEISLIPKETIVITVSNAGYIKTVKLSFYKSQKRGGKGRVGQNIKEEDFVTQVYIATTHTEVLFFSNKGRVYKLKAYKLPSGDPGARGRALVNLLQLDVNEFITSVMMVPEDGDDWNIIFTTARGKFKRNSLDEFRYVPINGKVAIVLAEDDCLIAVRACKVHEHVLLSTCFGKSIRFAIEDVRQFKGRNSSGLSGITLANGDKVVSVSLLNNMILESDLRTEYLRISIKNRLAILEDGDIYKKINTSIAKDDILKYSNNENFILTVTENGYGKISSSYEYRQTARKGSGIINIITSKRNGNVVASFAVSMSSHLMLITNKGQMIRISVKDISIVSRNTQGVTLFKVKNDEKVVSVAEVINEEEVSIEPEDESDNIN